MDTSDFQIYPLSDTVHLETRYYLSRDTTSGKKYLCVEGNLENFVGEIHNGTRWCPLSPENANALRSRIHWLVPQPIGVATSFGFGDRLGIATPGHIAALGESEIVPIFAQQSVRENARTGRDPQTVLDDAMWGVFQTGWTKPWGADADHVKEIRDLNPFIQAGYTFFTIDPNEYVDNDAASDIVLILEDKFAKLPWHSLEISPEGLAIRYLDHSIELGTIRLDIQKVDLLRAACKYGRAIAHAKGIADYLTKELNYFDLEISVDETDTPTTIFEHYYLANELRRLGVKFTSLAPRFVGSFEKGVDYIGDIYEFDISMQNHAAVMHSIGGYKLSIHTGSDKFSIYPSIAKHTRKLVHVKTAGTSYLEALKVIASVDPSLFRRIFNFACTRFDIDKKSYIISAQLDRVPSVMDLDDVALPKLIEQFDARQMLHVTYGSILDKFHSEFMEILPKEQNLYDQFIKSHFIKHLEPFCN